MGVPRIAVIPFLKGNFACPYCVSYAYHEASFGMWDDRFNDICEFGQITTQVCYNVIGLLELQDKGGYPPTHLNSASALS